MIAKHSNGSGGGGGTRGTTKKKMMMFNKSWSYLRATSSTFFLVLVVAMLSERTDAIFSNVEVSNFGQSALELSFRVSWSTGVGASAESSSPAGSDTVDVWLLTRQPNPSSWMETKLRQVGSPAGT